MSLDSIDFKLVMTGGFPDIDFMDEVTGVDAVVNECISCVLASPGDHPWSPQTGTPVIRSKGSPLFESDLSYIRSTIISNLQSNPDVQDASVSVSNDNGVLTVIAAIKIGGTVYTKTIRATANGVDVNG